MLIQAIQVNTDYTGTYRLYRHILAIHANTGYTGIYWLYMQIQAIQVYTCHTGLYMPYTSIFRPGSDLFGAFPPFPRRRLLRDGCQELSSTALSMLRSGCAIGSQGSIARRQRSCPLTRGAVWVSHTAIGCSSGQLAPNSVLNNSVQEDAPVLQGCHKRIRA